MWLTPIMWYVEMFADNPFYGILCEIIKFNPVYYIVTGFRDSMIAGNYFWSCRYLTLYFWGVTIVLLLVGLKVFKKLRPHFSDVL